MASSVEQIKSRLGIVDVVGSYLKLEKAGSNFRAVCPFHNEKTPSFFVSPGRESYHCFGCNKGGDIFSFVQEIEGIDFLGSLEVLAERAGVELKPVNLKERSESERLLAVLEAATVFYEDQLKHHTAVRDYLSGRGLLEETSKRFRLGFAPAGWRNLTDYIINLGFTELELEKAGLIVFTKAEPGSRGSRSYDRFRERIMFPLRNSVGKVVGFSGRVFGDKKNDQGGKYINSPQTLHYDKSRILYGFDFAKQTIRQAGSCVLVEGQMDLILAHQSGMTNTIAVSGTALTSKHLEQINRLTNNLVMAFDGDLAGLAASRRAVDMALVMGMEVKIAELPPGEDPADVIARSPGLWYSRVTEAKHVVDFYLSILSKRGYNLRTLALAVSKEVLPYVAQIPNAIDQAHFVAKISDMLQVGEEPIWTEIKKSAKGIKPALMEKAPTPSTMATRREMIERRLRGILLWQQTLPESQLDINETLNTLRTIDPDAYQRLIVADDKEKNELLLEAELAYEGMTKLNDEVKDLLNQLEVEVLKAELDSLARQIKIAERGEDYEKLNDSLKRCQQITSRINELKHLYEKK